MHIHKIVFFFLGLLISLGAVLRLANLNSLPIFADESIYIRWSQVMKAESTLRFLPLSDGKTPLYMWATIPFLKFISDPLLAGRALSALVGLGTILGVGFAAFILFKSQRIALIAALIWTVLPYSVFFERMALSDAMLGFFILWAFNFMALALQHVRLDLAMISGFCLGFAWLTKSPAEFAFVLLPLLLLLVDFRPHTKIKLLKSAGLFLAAYVIAFAMYNILRLGPEFQQIALRNKDYLYPLLEVLRHPLDPLLPHLRDSLGFYWYLATPIGCFFILWGIFDSWKIHLRQRVILTLWLLAPIFAQAFLNKTFTARYLLFTVPFAVILMAHGIEHLGQRTRRHFLVYSAAGVMVALCLWFDFTLITSPDSVPLPRIERSGYLEEWTAGQGLRAVSAQIAQAAQSGPVVVGSEGFFGTPFNALQLYLNRLPNVRVIGVGVYIDSVSDKLTSALADNQVFLVVNSTRFHNIDPAKSGLQLLASYPKSIRPDGTREYLLFFKVLHQ